MLAQITALEDEFRIVLREQQTHLFYQIKGIRIEFESSIRRTHRKLKIGILHQIVTDRPLNCITGPVVYSLIFPLVILDFFAPAAPTPTTRTNAPTHVGVPGALIVLNTSGQRADGHSPERKGLM